MIKKVTKEYEYQIKKYIEHDVYQNIYLYIDIELYGFNNNNVKTYMLIDGKDLKIILFKYYNSLQLFKTSELGEKDICELVDFIYENKFDMICGITELIEKISDDLKLVYKRTDGYIFSCNKIIGNDKIVSKIAEDGDFDEIAQLICSNDSIGGHYNSSVLKEQFIDRKDTMGCKNIIIKEDDKIVSHAATYANSNLISVIGGVITREGYGGKGYGSQVVNDLVNIIQSEGKTPILYCYDSKVMEWYKKMGWKKINTSSKLELINEK